MTSNASRGRPHTCLAQALAQISIRCSPGSRLAVARVLLPHAWLRSQRRWSRSSVHASARIGRARSRAGCPYLRRWAGIAGKGEHTVEMFARSVASHVLDAGFSAQHVRQLLKAKASGPDPITLAEICEELHGMQTSNPTIAEAFHRLYRQRNLVLHGGRLDSVTLKASLRTVSKLAGAGMDRITHGHYVQSVRPLELVARANLSIALISKERALDCVDLLE